jgi:hypothetical protein
MVSSFSSDNKEKDERGATMLRAMLDNQDVKLGIEREKVKPSRWKLKPT